WPASAGLFQRFQRFVQVSLVWVLLGGGHMASVAGVNTGLAGDDYVAGPFPIGFEFRYHGQAVTQFYASTNGLLQFANPSNAYSNSCLTSGGGPGNTIFVFWDDLRTDVSGQPAGKIQYETIGQAPHRKLVVQWTNQYFYGSNLPMGTFQAVLHEGSNEVKLQYRYLREAQSTGSSATIGMRGPSGQVNQHSCNQLNAVAAEQAISYMP